MLSLRNGGIHGTFAPEQLLLPLMAIFSAAALIQQCAQHSRAIGHNQASCILQALTFQGMAEQMSPLSCFKICELLPTIRCLVDYCLDSAIRMQAAGVHVHDLNYEGTCHGFLGFPVPQAAEALDASAGDLRAAFSAW